MLISVPPLPTSTLRLPRVIEASETIAKSEIVASSNRHSAPDDALHSSVDGMLRKVQHIIPQYPHMYCIQRKRQGQQLLHN